MLYDYEAIDTKVQIANARYLYGWSMVKDEIDGCGIVPNDLINQTYENEAYTVGWGFEDACNHYMNDSCDEPCMTDKPWVL